MNLTRAQSGIWFAQRLDPRNPVYNLAECVRVDGPVDAGVLERALRRVVAETDALRIRIVGTDDAPLQIVRDTVDWDLAVVRVDDDGAADRWMHAEHTRAIDPRADPLFRFALLRTADDRHVWYQRYHHLLVDGLSIALIERRVAELYSAFLRGATPHRPRSDRCRGSSSWSGSTGAPPATPATATTGRGATPICPPRPTSRTARPRCRTSWCGAPSDWTPRGAGACAAWPVRRGSDGRPPWSRPPRPT